MSLITPRTRKLIGTIILLLFLVFYGLIIAAIAEPILTAANRFSEFLFYLIAGLAWVIPAGVIIWWMQTPRG